MKDAIRIGAIIVASCAGGLLHAAEITGAGTEGPR